jgi:hypothetical protein
MSYLHSVKYKPSNSCFLNTFFLLQHPSTGSGWTGLAKLCVEFLLSPRNDANPSTRLLDFSNYFSFKLCVFRLFLT